MTREQYKNIQEKFYALGEAIFETMRPQPKYQIGDTITSTEFEGTDEITTIHWSDLNFSYIYEVTNHDPQREEWITSSARIEYN